MIKRFINKTTQFVKIPSSLVEFDSNIFNRRRSTVSKTMETALKLNSEVLSKEAKSFKNVPNILIVTNDNERYTSLARKLENVLDPSKVCRFFL